MMIIKISTVMGVEFPHDPDESYVLTVDNVIKILAIQMRFRYIAHSIAAWTIVVMSIGVVFLLSLWVKLDVEKLA